MSEQRQFESGDAGSTAGRPDREPLPRAVAGARSLDAFNPLLRSLLSWELIKRVDFDDGSHRWELTESAQQRLDELTPERQRAATTLAYLDHWCSHCREQRLTHLIEGRYICAECQRLEAIAPAAQPAGRRAKARALPRLLHKDARQLRWNQ